MPRLLTLIVSVLLSLSALGQAVNDKPSNPNPAQPSSETLEQHVDQLKEPLYSPFIERYILDEMKQLRIDMAAQKSELIQQVVDREIGAVDRTVNYATNTVTYFFYLIAGASSLLVLVGWSSLRDVKDKVHRLADEEINRLVREYESRLSVIEEQLSQKTRHIEENREEIELTREMHAMWLRAAQESNPANKIAIYDQILSLDKQDCEALTYKADAVLELGEPQWAANLCHQALAIDPSNSHAFYQLGCAYTLMGQHEDALRYLAKALALNEAYREEIPGDPALSTLRDMEGFAELLQSNVESASTLTVQL